MKLNFSVPVIALLGGAALGFCLRGTSSVSGDGTAEEEGCAKTRQVEDAGSASSIEALRRRVRELEGMLAKAAEDSPKEVSVEENRERDGMRGRFNPREMMERMKKEDPERFSQMTNHMANFRRRRTEQAQSRLDFLSSIDLSSLGEDAQETHSRLQALIAKREEIEQRMHSGEDGEAEDFESVMHEMHEIEREMRQLNNAERKNLLTETVYELGISGDDADEVVATISDIIEATQGHGFGPPHGDGGPGGGPRRER